MNYKPIVIVAGEPNSIFFEIFFKSFKKKYKSPIILVASLNLLKNEMNKFKLKKKINLIDVENIKKIKLEKNIINLINVNYDLNYKKNKDLKKSNLYIDKCFKKAFKLIKIGFTYKLINGPISKKKFLKKKYLGVTEYISHNFNIKNNAMLIYNKNLSVCPLTTHLPIKFVARKISKKLIYEKIYLINNFYKKIIKIKPKIAVLGLNPHCESVSKFNEDDKIIAPSIKYLKNLNFSISGPYSADTFFMKQNRKKFDVVIGMYHDQVLTPLKTLFEYNAINITLGLPFLRISPDHGPNEKMIGKNISDPTSLIEAISFLDKN